MNDFLGLTVFVAVALIGLGGTVVGSVRGWRLIRRAGIARAPAVFILVLATFLLLFGLWIIFDVYWIGAGAVKVIGRIKPRHMTRLG